MKRTLLSTLAIIALVASAPMAGAQDMDTITGHVFYVTDARMVLTTPDGPRMFTVTEDSVVPDSITEDDYVTVWYTDRPAFGDLAVSRVDVATGSERLSGEVVELTGERVSVNTGNTIGACAISLDTRRPADLAVGEEVDVWYTRTDDDLVASRITRRDVAVEPAVEQAQGHVFYLTPTTLVLRTPGEARMFSVADASIIPDSVDVDDYIEVWYTSDREGELVVTRVAEGAAPAESAGTVVAQRPIQQQQPATSQRQVTTTTTDTGVRCYTGVVENLDDDRMVLMTDTGRTTVSFDVGTRRPYDLRTGDRVDVWCVGDDVDRVALLERDVTVQVAEAPTRTTLPQTATRLPLLGLLGLIGVGAGLALRFTVRA